MKRNKLTETLIIALIITIVMPNITILGNKTFATLASLETQDTNTNNESVNFDMYFKNENGQKVHEITANKEIEQTLYMYIKVTQGYLKETTINIENSNFKINKEKVNLEQIENVEENAITLSKILNEQEVELALPIVFAKANDVPQDIFSKETSLSLNGTLVKNNNKTKKVSKDLKIKINWEGTAEAELNQEIIKYIPYSVENTKRVILQTKVTTNILNNTLPVKNTKIEVSLPSINKISPSKIYVTSETSNFTFNQNKETLTIESENEVKNEKINWKENYKEEFIITYVFDEKAYSSLEENTVVALNATAAIECYNLNKTLATKNTRSNEILNAKISDIVTLDTKLQEKLSKGYMYTGYKTEYSDFLTIDIADSELVNKVIINSNKDKFVTSNETEATISAKYKAIKINKENLINILGEEGFIKIYNKENVLIGTLNKDSLEVKYEEPTETIKIETSKPQTVGKLKIENSKVILENKELTEEQISEIKALQTSYGISALNEKTEIINKISSVTANLEEPKVQVETKLSTNVLSTTVENENVQIITVLKNSDVTCKLLKNPKLKIKLPEYIQELKVNNSIQVLFTDELKIKSALYNQETKTIDIELDGEQTKYNDVSVADGATIVLDLNLVLNQEMQNEKDQIITYLTNENETVENKTEITYVMPNTEVIEQNEEQLSKVETPTETQTIETNQVEERTQTEFKETENRVLETNLGANEVQDTKQEIPNVDISLKTDLEDTSFVMEGQVINYTAQIVNMGNTILNNLTLTIPVPEGTTCRKYIKGTSYSTDEIVETEDTVSSIYVETLKPNQSAKVELQVIVNEKGNRESIKSKAILIKEGYKNLETEELTSFITDGIINIDMFTYLNESYTYKVGDEIKYLAYIKNIKENEEASNIEVTSKIPNGLEYVKAEYMEQYDNDYNQVEYNKEQNLVTWKISSISAKANKGLILTLKVKENIGKIENKISAICSNSTGTVYSNTVTREIANAKLDVNFYTDVNSEYVTVKDVINYYIEISNNGNEKAKNIKVEDVLPDYMKNVKASYKTNTIEKENIDCENKTVTLSGFTLEPGETLKIKIQAEVDELPSNSKGTINLVNSASIKADEIDELKPNSITHKIKAKNANNVENKKVSISGIAWKDSSRNGARDEGEELLKNINVYLITKQDAKLVKQTKTNKKGEYTFEDIEKGEYIIVFNFDTSRYDITTYMAENVKITNNSDAALNQVTFLNDGTSLEGAVTDTLVINESNFYNIDLGLLDNTKFDLSLNKTITKVTKQTSKETVNYDYSKNGKTLAKIEIPSSEANKTTVIVEYTITVKNEGNIPGYAKQIVDYLPSYFKFPSEANPDWYIGKDGKLYSNALANTVINPGESKEVKLVVTKQTTENNLGLTTNEAEIAESYNDYGVQDIDSKEKNKVTKEDDYGSADLIISLNTGTIAVYTGLSICIIAIIAVIIYGIKRRKFMEV